MRPVRVLACLTDDTVTVIVFPGVGLADGGIRMPLSLDLVPPDLRTPNSEFEICFGPRGQEYTRIETKSVT